MTAEDKSEITDKVSRELKSNKSNYMKPNLGDYPETIPFAGRDLVKAKDLRYGENPHQTAALYVDPAANGAGIANCRFAYEGKKSVSAINMIDANDAFLLMTDLTQMHGKDIAVAVPVKHGTPSGVGLSYEGDLALAYVRAYECDPQSIFGCTMAVNREVGLEFAERLKELYLECLLAPSYTEEAKSYFSETKKNLRLMETGSLERIAEMEMEIIPVVGGFVVQQPFYSRINTAENLEVVTKRQPTHEEYKAMLTMWRVAARIKSNAVVLGDSVQAFGMGTGQMSRVASARIAIYNANNVFCEGAENKARGSVGASDAFFPYPDGPRLLAEAGMTAIVYPLGSEKDKETIAVWDEFGVAACCTRPVPGTNEIERCFSGHR
jgi:phosphoribosylaminoimidazolecarboxamide formyltransferase/IMP cyclohydrolase